MDNQKNQENQSGMSVVITTYKALDYLKLCVRSLLENSEQEHQLVIYADGSGVETLEYLQSLRDNPNIKYRYEEENVGITRATNRAAELADREYLYLINDDMVFAPGFDSALMRHVKPNRTLTTTLIEPEHANSRVGPAHISRSYGLRHEDFNWEEFRNTVGGLGEDRLEPGIGFPLLIERQLWLDIGALDERFTGPCSDPDLYYRIALRNVEMLRVRDSLSYHFSGRSVRFEGERVTVSPRWIREETQGKVAFVRKWGERPNFSHGGMPHPGVMVPDQKLPIHKSLLVKIHEIRYRRQERRKLAQAE